MKAVISLILTCLVASAASAADARYTIDDPYVGVYQGSFQGRLISGKAQAQIRSRGNGAYDGFVAMTAMHDGAETLVSVGDISEFRPGSDPTTKFGAVFPEGLRKIDEKAHPGRRLPGMTITGEISPGKISGGVNSPFGNRTQFKFEMNRVKAPQSATLGAEPPKDAIVLFDGKDHGQWKEEKWQINDGALEVGPGNLVAKQSLTNFLLHVEFRTPNKPEALGQERGNSGVYLRSVFEVQVLDSFGLFPLEDNDCGGIYKVRAPDVNMINACLPPGEWQTYDITFHDGDQKANRPPEITVVQNGKTIVDRAKVPMDLFADGTGGGEKAGGFLMLQDHGNPVQYRNIWAMPIE